MEEIKDEVSKQLNEIGAKLGDLESLSRILQICLEDEDNLKNWDIKIIFEILKLKITETKEDFGDITKILKI